MTREYWAGENSLSYMLIFVRQLKKTKQNIYFKKALPVQEFVFFNSSFFHFQVE